MAGPVFRPVIGLAYYLTSVEEVWRPQDHTASKFIKAIKGKEINRYFELPVTGGRVIRYDNNNKHEVLPLVQRALASKISSWIPGNFTIVPIPNSEASIDSSESFKTLEMANAVAALIGDRATVIPAIRWRRSQPPAHSTSAFRDPQVFYENMKLLSRPKGDILLFDDVITTGAHMIAAYKKLTDAGCTVRWGAVIGKSTKVQETHMIGWHETNLEVVSAPFRMRF